MMVIESKHGGSGMRLRFTKYHGLGNDFIFIEDLGRNLVPNAERLAESLCHRKTGIGADGLVLIARSNDLYSMQIFNSDGTQAEMCGNAIRCMARHLVDEKNFTEPVLRIETVGGVKEVHIHHQLYAVDMGEPDLSFNSEEPVEIFLDGKEWIVHPVSMGNPHGVAIVPDLDSLDFHKWGPILESHPVWPNKANIEFVQVLDRDYVRVRVWERGAGPTFACGTGACAAVVVCARLGLTEREVTVSLPGGDLLIEWAPNNHVWMTGPAVRVFSGEVEV